MKKLSMCEASLEVNTRYRSDLEEEKARTIKDMDRLKTKVLTKHLQNTHSTLLLLTTTAAITTITTNITTTTATTTLTTTVIS